MTASFQKCPASHSHISCVIFVGSEHSYLSSYSLNALLSGLLLKGYLVFKHSAVTTALPKYYN